MNIKNKIIILFLLIVNISHCGFSQDISSYNNKINSVFQYVDKSRIQTGLMYDFGLQVIDPLFYDGTSLTDENYTDIDVWKTLYGGMYSSKINNKASLLPTDEIIQKN